MGSTKTGSIGEVVEDADDEDGETVAPTCMSGSTGPIQRGVAAGSVRCVCAMRAAHRERRAICGAAQA